MSRTLKKDGNKMPVTKSIKVYKFNELSTTAQWSILRDSLPKLNQKEIANLSNEQVDAIFKEVKDALLNSDYEFTAEGKQI